MHSQVLSDKRSRVLFGSLLILSPILLTPAYLHAADLWPLWWDITDIVAGVTIIAVGVTGICLLPLPSSWRAALSGGYLVPTAWLLFLSAISFRGGI